jgi:hypothetical protein
MVVVGALIPALWPMFVATDTAIQALSDGSSMTDFLQVMWPISLIVIAIGIAVALIYYALKKFGLFKEK